MVPSHCSGERSLSSGKVIAGWGNVQGFNCIFSDKKRRLHKQHKKREQVLSFRFCAEPYVNDFEIQSEANARSERDKNTAFSPAGGIHSL